MSVDAMLDRFTDTGDACIALAQVRQTLDLKDAEIARLRELVRTCEMERLDRDRKPDKPLVFIIGPFRAETPWDVRRNTMAAEELGLQVAYLGAMPVIPHANTAHFDKLLTDEFWLAGTRSLLSVCHAAITLPKWRESEGSRAEVDFCEANDIPCFADLDDLENWLYPEGR